MLELPREKQLNNINIVHIGNIQDGVHMPIVHEKDNCWKSCFLNEIFCCLNVHNTFGWLTLSIKSTNFVLKSKNYMFFKFHTQFGYLAVVINISHMYTFYHSIIFFSDLLTLLKTIHTRKNARKNILKKLLLFKKGWIFTSKTS